MKGAAWHDTIGDYDAGLEAAFCCDGMYQLRSDGVSSCPQPISSLHASKAHHQIESLLRR